MELPPYLPSYWFFAVVPEMMMITQKWFQFCLAVPSLCPLSSGPLLKSVVGPHFPLIIGVFEEALPVVLNILS